MAKKKASKSDEDFVSTGDAAARLKVYPTTIRKYFDLGLLTGRILPFGRRQISRKSLEALVRRMEQGEKIKV